MLAGQRQRINLTDAEGKRPGRVVGVALRLDFLGDREIERAVGPGEATAERRSAFEDQAHRALEEKFAVFEARKSDVMGKSVSGRVDLGGCRIIKQKKTI